MKAIIRGAVVAFLLVFSTGSAAANLLVSTSPASGTTLSTSPTSVTVTGQLPLLADAVDANVITVTDPKGNRVDDGTITITDLSASVGVKSLIESGIYTVKYSLIAEADAPLEGSFTFRFLAPTTIASAQPNPEPTKSQAPASSSFGTNIFVIVILLLAITVTIGLSLYARKLFVNR